MCEGRKILFCPCLLQHSPGHTSESAEVGVVGVAGGAAARNGGAHRLPAGRRAADGVHPEAGDQRCDVGLLPHDLAHAGAGRVAYGAEGDSQTGLDRARLGLMLVIHLDDLFDRGNRKENGI